MVFGRIVGPDPAGVGVAVGNGVGVTPGVGVVPGPGVGEGAPLGCGVPEAEGDGLEPPPGNGGVDEEPPPPPPQALKSTAVTAAVRSVRANTDKRSGRGAALRTVD